MKKIVLLLLLILFMFTQNAFAYKKVNVNATVEGLEFETETKQIVYIKTEHEAELKNVAYLPENATLKAEVVCIQKEKRWHKSAYALLKLISFVPENSETTIDISEDDLYLIVRRYIPVNLPSAAGTGIELSTTTVASFFLPGIDLAYYFTKGAITKEKHPNWFKSGVSEAYDNSIFWFFEKGRKIQLEEETSVQIKSLSDKKIKKLTKIKQ